ncbi:MAG: alanine racemase [Chloroflexi bacterium]|nr:MAG: alanine racemase [Chloroflexota bacterium]
MPFCGHQWTPQTLASHVPRGSRGPAGPDLGGLGREPSAPTRGASLLTEQGATKWADVDTSAITHNTNLIKQLVGPKTAVMAVVKANGYGHGAVPAARAALKGGATWLGVSSVPEGIELRKAGIPEPILNLGYTPVAALSAAVAAKLSLTVYDREGLGLVKTAATDIGVHVKLDSGMHRLGAAPDEAVRLAMEVDADPDLRLEGFWTHFADADGDAAFTKEQLRIFLDARAALVRGGATNFLSHTANSPGLLRFPEARLDLVRAGLLIYGVRPERHWDDLPTLRPALTWQTIVTHVMTVPAGASVGYGRRFRAPAPARVATIALGYGDGLHRRASEGGEAIVRGMAVPLAGTISMDQAALDVTNVRDVAPGDVVTVIGQDGEATLTAYDLAEASGTISYEVLCAISARVARRYT